MRYRKRQTSILSTGLLAWLLRGVNTRIKRIVALTLVLFLATTLFLVHGDNATHNNNDVGDTFPQEYIAHGCCHTAEGRGVEMLGHHGHGSKDIVYYVLHIYRGQAIADILPLVPMQSGHSFTHWSRQPNGAPFDFNRPIMTEMRFYAIWEAEANDYYNPQGGYISYAPEYLYNPAPEYTYNYYEYYQAQEYNYSVHNHSYTGQNYYYGQRQEDGHDNTYSYDNGYSYDYGNISYSPLYGYISYTPHYLFYEEGHYQAYGLDGYSYTSFDYPYGYASYGLIYYNSQPSSGYYYGYVYDREYEYYHSYDYAYDNYFSHVYSYNNYDNNYDSHYVHGYEYEYGYEYAHEQEPLYHEYEDNYYRDTPAYGDTITITFLYNHGGYWPDYSLHNLTGKLNIAVDNYANITVYPQVMHGILLDGEYFHIKFPMAVYFGDISVIMANSNWTYEISHQEEENITLEAGPDGEVTRVYETQIYTVVTISHDILETHTQLTEIIYLQVDNPGQGRERGFVPFASNEPFTMAILAPPFDGLLSWIAALGPTTENRVVVLPQDVEVIFPWALAINTPRHVILTSYGTNLNFSTTNHTAPPTVFTMYFASPTGWERHFTVSNGGTLTLSHITLDGMEETLPGHRGGINLGNNGNLHMLSGSTIQHNRGGAVVVDGTAGTFTMSGNSRIYRNTAPGYLAGAGVVFHGARTLSMYDNASISHNHNATSGAGVGLFASGSHLIMNDNSSISHNISSTFGAGVILSNGAQLTMNGGSINNNSVSGASEGAPIGRGGGVHISGPNSIFTFNSGSIHGNHASASGGGIFATQSVYSKVLPMGAFPQLNIAPEASFSNNTAGLGDFTPPVNALAATNIQTTQSSGGFPHPLNNLDINFANIDADWFRLNAAIHGTSATNIVLHPAGTTSVADGITGSTYNLIISDPSDDGNVITTIDLSGAGFTDHFIEITRTVTIQAADGADIILRMPAGAPNTPDIAPWITNHAAIGRHFMVVDGGDLTLNGIGTGTLTLDGNADLVTANRGGIVVGSWLGPGSATLGSGAVVTNNRTFNGGGVALANSAHLTIDGGVISHNFATNGGGVHLAAGATISLEFISGQIISNHALMDGGGIFTSTFTQADPLPAGSFPQLTVAAAAAFSGNTAGSSYPPPANAVAATQIQATAQVSGGYSHPLNNLDINFRFGDWARLNNVIQALPNPGTVVIHPAGAGVSPGLVGSTYTFVISPGNGSTIETIRITGATPGNTHRIAIGNRTVTLSAAAGANIVLDMTSTAEANIGRHFQITAANGHLILGGGTGTITLNGNADTLPGYRGGVGVNFAANTTLTLAQGSVIYNNRAQSGGGVQQMANTRLHMNGGTITGNIASGNGGGVFLVASPLSRLYFNSGTISNNTAIIGGGIFSGTYSYADPLPAGAFPQLVISTAAVFYGNNATTGGMLPPANPGPPTTAITNAAWRSGGFAHPLNNLDINFIRDDYIDWMRLNRVINNMTPAPHTITIHPHDAGIVEGPVGAPGTYYNFVISDPALVNYINTLPIGTGTNHAININRTVTVRHATGQNIVLNMDMDGGPHFNVTGSGNLTLGEGGSTGTLTLTANWTDYMAIILPIRGGIHLTGSGVLNLQTGAILRENSTNSVGGAVRMYANGITVNMFEGSYITNNVAGNGGGGIGFRATGDFASVINIFGGTISNNVAPWAGGIWAQSGTVNMYGGNIINNNAGLRGAQAPNAGALDGLIDNPHGAGGGVRICCRGSFIMHDGVIADNTARYGGGMLISHGTTVADPITSLFVMYGGSIINNTATLADVNPANQRPGWVHNQDGGGIFIMSSGQFVMRDHPNEIRTITISGNTADQHGGGVYYQVGRWDTNERTQPVIMENNEAIEDGGGIFLSYRTLDMYGEWSIGHNTANRGGGIFLHGDITPHTYDPMLGWRPHPLMGDGRLIMHDEDVRIHNNHSHTSGGGVYIPGRYTGNASRFTRQQYI